MYIQIIQKRMIKKIYFDMIYIYYKAVLVCGGFVAKSF